MTKEYTRIDFDTPGLVASIYKDHKGDCSNGGISSEVERVWVPCPDGHMTVGDLIKSELWKTKRTAVCTKVKRELWQGHISITLEPYTGDYESPDSDMRDHTDSPGMTDFMMGGCFVWSSDSRFSREYGDRPVPLHDRRETWEQYNALSR